jgi:hypothetical protein
MRGTRSSAGGVWCGVVWCDCVALHCHTAAHTHIRNFELGGPRSNRTHHGTIKRVNSPNCYRGDAAQNRKVSTIPHKFCRIEKHRIRQTNEKRKQRKYKHGIIRQVHDAVLICVWQPPALVCITIILLSPGPQVLQSVRDALHCSVWGCGGVRSDCRHKERQRCSSLHAWAFHRLTHYECRQTC